MKEWVDSTRDIADVSTAAIRAATNVAKLKVKFSLKEDLFAECLRGGIKSFMDQFFRSLGNICSEIGQQEH